MLKRKKECDTYLNHIYRNHCSRESPVKRWNIRNFQPTLWHSSAIDVDWPKWKQVLPRGKKGSKCVGGLVRLLNIDTGRLLGLNYKLIYHFNLYFNPDSILVSIFDNLTWFPPLLFPFSSLATAASTLVSLRLQLMKAIMLAESSLYFIFSPGSLYYSDIYSRESGRR